MVMGSINGEQPRGFFGKVGCQGRQIGGSGGTGVALEGLRWVGSSRREQGRAGVLLPPSQPPFPGAKPAAAYRMQMEKMQFVVSVR